MAGGKGRGVNGSPSSRPSKNGGGSRSSKSSASENRRKSGGGGSVSRSETEKNRRTLPATGANENMLAESNRNPNGQGESAHAAKKRDQTRPEESEDEGGMSKGEGSDDEDDEEHEDFHDAREERQESPSSKPAASDTSLPDEVEAESRADTASTMTGQYYLEAFARRLLKASAVMYENMVMRYVVCEVFKDLKFTQGDDDEEMGLAELAIDEEYVKIEDSKIPTSAFVNEFYPCISKFVTKLRTRSQNNARKKFMRELERDRKDAEKPDVLPESLSDILLDGRYRDYVGSNGKVPPEREYDYEAYKWFVKNVLCCVNHEFTELLSKQVADQNHSDFITKTFTASDEAFAIMLVVNYKNRWRNQVLYPTTNKNVIATDPKYATKYTSSKRGYCKLPWSSDGIELYNSLVAKVEKLRSNSRTGFVLESLIKTDFATKKKSKRRKLEVIETRPVMGGALQAKLAKLKNKAAV